MTLAGHRALLQEEARLIEARPLERDEAARAQLDHRLALVKATLESVRVVEPVAPDGTVRFGSVVELEWDDGRTQRVWLVGPDEADGVDGRVNVESPLGRALVGQREGDEVEVTRPRGVATATLVSVR